VQHRAQAAERFGANARADGQATMTATVEAARVETEPAAALPRAAMIGIMAAGVQTGVILDGVAPISVMIEPLLQVVNDRLTELGEAELSAAGRGRWALCRVDGTALRSAQSLTEQNVFDGDRLWLRFLEDTERRTPITEHVSTAVATDLSRRFRAIDSVTAVRVGVWLLGAGVLLSAGLLAGWRYRHEGWLATGCAAAITTVLLAVAAITLAFARSADDHRAGDILVLSGLPAVAVTAASAIPGPVGAPHAALGFGVLSAISVVLARFTGRRLATYTAVVTISAAVTIAAVARMLTSTGTVTLFGCLFIVSVLGYHCAAPVARWCAGIRLPVFPSATSQWVFEARPDLPAIVRIDRDTVVLEGPESVSGVMVRAERARLFLTGLLAGLGVLTVSSVTGLCDPLAERRWLPLLVAGLTAGFLIMRGRSFMDRYQAIVVTVTGVGLVAMVVLRFVIELWSPLMLVIGLLVLLTLPGAGLLAAVVVPNTTYSPLFRKFVEWVEYLCLIPLFPLVLWVMNVFEAIRYR
jgi:type VII secretion integral membrane protein EccD